MKKEIVKSMIVIESEEISKEKKYASNVEIDEQDNL